MRFTLAPFVMAAIATLCSVSALAQTIPEPRPLQAMPYSPSLDLTSLDRKVDPCTNFYGFTCGGWVAGHRIPEDQASWSVYAKLAADNQQFLWGILEEDAKASDRTPVQQKVGDYFAACMDTAAIDAAGLQPLRPALDRIASLTTRDAIAAAIPWLRRDVPGSSFFGSGTEQDSIDASLVIVSVEAADLGLPDRDYYLKTDPASIAIREQYRSFVVQLLVLGGEPPAEAGADAVAIVALETELAKASLTRVDLRDPHATYHPMPIAELSALVPSVDWTAYFAAQGVAAQRPGRVRKINVSQPALLRAVQLQLATAPLAQLRAYLRFHALAGAAPALSQPFAQASFDFYSHTLRGIVAMPPRWKTCVRAADRDLGEALGQEFVRRTFDADTRAKTLRMAEQIETAMDGEIRSLDWMGAATKVEALRKLHVVRNKIGYPDTWRDYGALTVARDDHFGNVQRAGRFEDARQWAKLGKPVDLAEWSMTPPTVNAYFDPQKNDINFPAGVLQPPLYDARLDDAPNYGNTGATIGHELTHAFDDAGRQYDAAGNLRDWWTPADAKGFEERVDCVRDQYAGYVVVDDIHINSRLTSGEDVADLGGTLLAYIAWRKQTEHEQLADRDGFTPVQRFFVGMAQWACEIERPEDLRVNAVTDEHSPAFARVNGVLANLPQFGEAFACKAGQPMVHTPACKVW